MRCIALVEEMLGCIALVEEMLRFIASVKVMPGCSALMKSIWSSQSWYYSARAPCFQSIPLQCFLSIVFQARNFEANVASSNQYQLSRFLTSAALRPKRTLHHSAALFPSHTHRASNTGKPPPCPPASLSYLAKSSTYIT